MSASPSHTDSFPPQTLAEPAETGTLGVMHLKRAWSRVFVQKQRRLPYDPGEGHRDRLVFHALGLGLEEALIFIGRNDPTFDAFERWVLATVGAIPQERIDRIAAAILGAPPPPAIAARLAAIDAHPPVLSDDDLRFWDRNGYVVVPNAVPETSRLAAMEAVLALRGGAFGGARLDDPETWYRGQQSIMIQAYRHWAFEANRTAVRVHKAYAQIWQTADLWVTTDRVGFNPPERPGWLFQGPDLHWDTSLRRPRCFSTQGILYLTDTEAEQGAFTLVPEFHKRIDALLDLLPNGTDHRFEDMHALGSRPIAGKAGDLIIIIWDDALPHGSRPNRAAMPRIVQYIAMYPFAPDFAASWV